MQKDFDGWSRRKKKLNDRNVRFFAHQREIWWCSLGVNVGVEIDGKNRDFERPVLVLKVYNRESLLALPLTSRQKDDAFHSRIIVAGRPIWAALTQSRTISTRRLLRKIDSLNRAEFQDVYKAWKDYI